MQHTTLNQFDTLPDSAFIRVRDLPSIVGFSIPTIWRKTKAKEFPSPVKVSGNITAWRAGDVRTWLKDPMGFRDGTEV